ncbi:MAG: UvrD-helicase domain-containing protein [Bacteroidales bacterium]|nr:UvrD-helicase domain-containing protein [Bacteroidales bacterium]
MNIIKASAGSGKTFRLSHTYMDYLLASDDQWAYRHLLAVTFTNKATAEMKARILKDLEQAGKTNPRARKYLVSILHDYSAFGVCTIDRFFQQTLRAFARELGQTSSYQVELDRESLVREAMDRVLDGLTSDKHELVSWLKNNAIESLRSNGRFRLDDGLLDMGKRLKSESYRRLKASCGIDEQVHFAKGRLASIHRSCARVMAEFEKGAKELGLTPDKGRHYSYPTTKKVLEMPGVQEYLDSFYDDYATALIVDNQLYGLGVARDFELEFDALLREKNVMPLDESGVLLRDIIDGSDAPFVYEKTGTRYAHYLLDEFQDTSRLQWENFLPLLRDADAAGDNLIVGDVKQSIYRWRNSDWRMLDSEVKAEFPSAIVENPEFNWRSARRIVEFNSDFFEYAASVTNLSGMYSNVRQEPRTGEPQEGCVRVSFTSDQISAVLQSVADVLARGARFGDIAILVRGHAEGSDIADALIAADYPVISDDSLDLKGAVTVRRLVSLLTFYEDPSNAVGSYLASSIGVSFPDHYHSLVDFCEHLLREIRSCDPATFDAETLYVGAFMDLLQDWVAVNGNKLKAFLRDWDAREECYIGSPENSDAIRIMTVHKAKGLEFPHVIFPFADKVGLFKQSVCWCRLDGAGTSLGSVVDGIYPVNLSGSSVHTRFASAYHDEHAMQVVDNLNIFYVALTRASKSMHIIAKEVASAKKKALKSGKTIDWSNFSEMLYARCGCDEEYVYGTPYDFSRMKRKPAMTGIPFRAEWRSIPLGKRLQASQDADNYFGEGGLTGVAASGRLRGIELHRVLSGVDSAGDLPARLGDADRELLKARIEAHPEWFGGTAMARNELTVFAADGSRLRPDRVLQKPDGGIVIIDYKFGAERESYLWQVRRYVRLFRDMGHTDVCGYIWYVPEDKVVKV